MASAAFPYERHFAKELQLTPQWAGAEWMRDNLWVPCVVTVGYLVMLFVGQRLMRGLEPAKLKWTLTVWNAFQSVFSYAVAYSFWSNAWPVIMTKGLTYEACTGDVEYMSPWIWYFCISKILDMLDTFFLIIRKRPVSFLHWYHHVSVMWFCWCAWAFRQENGGLFGGMNAVVHSIMYTYYTVASTGVRFPNVIRSSVTLLQILQMVLGTAIVVHNIQNCNFVPWLQYSGLVMYISYFVLFLHFFYTNYIAPSPGDKHPRLSGTAAAKAKKAH